MAAATQEPLLRLGDLKDDDDFTVPGTTEPLLGRILTPPSYSGVFVRLYPRARERKLGLTAHETSISSDTMVWRGHLTGAPPLAIQGQLL